MKVLKIAGAVLLSIVALVLLLGAIAPKRVETVRSISINASQAAVFQTVNNLKDWEHWSPWQANDPTIQPVYSSPAAGVNAYYTWTSKNSGTGKLTITEVFGMDSLNTKIEFDGQGSATSGFRFTPSGKSTFVSWSFASDFPFPFNAMLLFQDFKATMDKDYDQGLALLKQYVEQRETTIGIPEVLE